MRPMSKGMGWVLVILLSMVSGLGQGTEGGISGVVLDEGGAVLPGVTMTVTHTDTGIQRTTVTDEGGRYHVPQLPVGNYEVKAELSGFQTTVQRGIKLTVGREATVNLTLKIGEITERIEITAEAPLIETSSAAVAGLVDERAIKDLPLNGRSFDQLLMLQSGVTVFRYKGGLTGRASSAVGFGDSFSIGGARVQSNRFLLDGTEMATPFSSATLPGNVAGKALGIEAIREFVVLTNAYSAAYGKRAGGQINILTQSGTNELHGSVFWFHRNDNLDARNFFDPGDPPEFKRNNFGFSVGGPLRKDRTFVFGTYEGLRERLGLSSVAIVLDAQAREGLLPDPRTGGVRQIQVAPNVRPFFVLFPLPNGRNFGDGSAELLSSPTKALREDFFLVRVDHNLTDRNSMFVKYNFDEGTSLEPRQNPVFEDPTRLRNQTVTIEDKAIVSSRLVNVFRFGFSRGFTEDDSVPAFDIGPGLAFIAGQDLPGSLRIGATGAGGNVLIDAGASVTSPGFRVQNFFQYDDEVSYTKGSHFLRIGTQIQRAQRNELGGSGQRGRFTFDSVEDFLLGNARNFNGATAGSDFVKGWRWTLFGIYLQDGWKVRPNFTLDLGLRYEVQTPFTEVNDEVSNFVTRVENGFRIPETEPRIGGDLFENKSLTALAPRIGFAWNPLSDGRTVLRAGFGMFYDQILPQIVFQINSNRPFINSALVFDPPFPRGLEAPAEQLLPSPDGIDRDFDVGTRLHYNLTLQRQFGQDTVFSTGYVGSSSYHLTSRREMNAAIPQILPDGRKFFPARSLRRNPALSSGQFITSDVNAFYHSFQADMTRRFSGGLRLKAAYTLSKSVDDRSNFLPQEALGDSGSIQDPDDRKANRGLSAFDVRHALTVNYTYDLPIGAGQGLNRPVGPVGKLLSGWQLNGIVTLMSGPPFTPGVGFNRSRNLDGGNPDRPNLRTGAKKNPVLGGADRADRYFDAEAFELQDAGFYGNLGRNTVIGPGMANVDFSVVKETSIAEERMLQFRVEMFNLFNRTNLWLPRNILFNRRGERLGSAGRAQMTTTTSRQIQFGLKFLF